MKTVLETLHWLLTLVVIAVICFAAWWGYGVYRWAWPHVREVEAIVWRMDKLEKTIQKLVPRPFRAEDDNADLPPLTEAEMAELIILMDELGKLDPDTPMSERCFELFKRHLKNLGNTEKE